MPRRSPIRREVLERIHRGLLCRLLAPYADALLALDLALPDLAATAQTDRRLVHRLYDLLLLHVDLHAQAGTPQLPAPLFAAFTAIAPVATPAGQQSLITASPALAALRLGPEDLAVTAYLDHPDAFRAARRGSDSDGSEPFTDFLASSPRPPSITPEALSALERALAAWLAARGRSARCCIHVTQSHGELHLEIEHGRPPRTDDVVGEALDLTQQTVVTTQRAHVVYDAGSGRLGIHASLPALKEALRQLVGEHLFGDANCFTSDAAYCLAPLADPDAALAKDDIPGAEAIELHGVKVAFAKARVTYETEDGSDLRASERAAEMREALRAGTITWAKLWLKVEGRKRPAVVELSPSRKKYLRTATDVERVLNELLLARGMMVLPTRGDRAAGDPQVSEPARAAPSSVRASGGAMAETG